jgi:hypothetical protein
MTACSVAPVQPEDPDIQFAAHPAPRKLRATFDYARGHVSAPVVRIGFKGKNHERRAAALVLPGCGFASRSWDLPPGTVLLTVDQNPDLERDETMTEACLHHDAAGIDKAVRANLRFMLDHLSQVELVDRHRVAILASGEAAPVIATEATRVRGKILLGDPCIVRWATRDLDKESPTIVLRGTEIVGVWWPETQNGPLPIDPTSMVRAAPHGVAKQQLALGAPCVGQRRIDFPKNFLVVEKIGRVGGESRPVGLEGAAHAAFERLTG